MASGLGLGARSRRGRSIAAGLVLATALLPVTAFAFAFAFAAGLRLPAGLTRATALALVLGFAFAAGLPLAEGFTRATALARVTGFAFAAGLAIAGGFTRAAALALVMGFARAAGLALISGALTSRAALGGPARQRRCTSMSRTDRDTDGFPAPACSCSSRISSDRQLSTSAIAGTGIKAASQASIAAASLRNTISPPRCQFPLNLLPGRKFLLATHNGKQVQARALPLDSASVSCHGNVVPTEIKICGLTNPEGVESALEAGADYLGFVFFAASPRNISIEGASRLMQRARGKAAIVALFVDPDQHFIDDVVGRLSPDFLQLHGQESPERVAAIRAGAMRPVIKAFGVGSSADLELAESYATVADHLVLDAKAPRGSARPGGHGAAFDWSLLNGFACATPWMLSGGLHPGNVAEALRVTRAPGVDVSSGVERAPGKKDPALIQAFVKAVRAVEMS